MVYGLADIVTIGRDGVRVVAGWTEPVTLASVAAGVGSASHVIDGAFYERCLAAHVTLATSAAVANRTLTLDLVDGNGVTQYSTPLASTVVASSTVTAYAAVGAEYSLAASGVSAATLPDLLFPPGYSFRFKVAGIDVADQVSAAGFLLQRYPSNLVSILQESGS